MAVSWLAWFVTTDSFVFRRSAAAGTLHSAEANRPVSRTFEIDHERDKVDEGNRRLEIIIEAKVNVLEDLVRKLKADRECFRVQNQQLSAEKLVEEAAKQRIEAKLLELERNSKSERASLEEQLKEHTKITKRLNKEIERQQSIWSDREEEMKQVNTEQQSLIKRLRNQVRELDVSLSDASQEIVSVRETSKAQSLKLQSLVEMEQHKHRSMQRDLDRLLKKEQALLQQLQNTTRLKEESIEIANAAVASANDRENDLQEKINQMQTEVQTLKMKLAQQKQHMLQMEDENKALLAHNKELQTELENQKQLQVQQEGKLNSQLTTTLQQESASREREMKILEQVQSLEDQMNVLLQLQQEQKLMAADQFTVAPGIWQRMRRRFSRNRKKS